MMYILFKISKEDFESMVIITTDENKENVVVFKMASYFKIGFHLVWKEDMYQYQTKNISKTIGLQKMVQKKLIKEFNIIVQENVMIIININVIPIMKVKILN